LRVDVMSDFSSERSSKQEKLKAARASMLKRHDDAVEEIETGIINRIESADQGSALSVDDFLVGIDRDL
jgi:hypothetical protein